MEYFIKKFKFTYSAGHVYWGIFKRLGPSQKYVLLNYYYTYRGASFDFRNCKINGDWPPYSSVPSTWEFEK
jgi:hypothetical protein